MRVICHGGAGGVPDEPEPRRAVLDEAAETGAGEASAVDAVVSAVEVLEESPRFNAGYGGAVQSDGIVRTDAGIMTDEREAGAVASMPGVANAAGVARVVMEETPHVFVSGVHAVDLAADVGVEVERDLLTDDERELFEDADPPSGGPADHLAWLAEKWGGHDTVGAVAHDPATDAFAACTSTGGRRFALAGRVGDVPRSGRASSVRPRAAPARPAPARTSRRRRSPGGRCGTSRRGWTRRRPPTAPSRSSARSPARRRA